MGVHGSADWKRQHLWESSAGQTELACNQCKHVTRTSTRQQSRIPCEVASWLGLIGEDSAESRFSLCRAAAFPSASVSSLARTLGLDESLQGKQ